MAVHELDHREICEITRSANFMTVEDDEDAAASGAERSSGG